MTICPETSTHPLPVPLVVRHRQIRLADYHHMAGARHDALHEARGLPGFRGPATQGPA